MPKSLILSTSLRIFRPSYGPDVEVQDVNLSPNGHQSTSIAQEGEYIFYLVKFAEK